MYFKSTQSIESQVSLLTSFLTYECRCL